MAIYNKTTTTTTIQGVSPNVDTIKELASIVDSGLILGLELSGADLLIKRNDGSTEQVDLTPISTGEVAANSVSTVDLIGTSLKITTTGGDEFLVDLSSLDQGTIVDSLSVEVSTQGSTIDEGLTSNISIEESLRISGDDSLETRITGITEYNDTSLVSRVSEVEGDLTSSTSSINDKIDGIVIPNEFDDSSLTTKVSSIESSLNGIVIPESFNPSSLEVRISGTDQSVSSLNSRFDNIGGATYNDASIQNRLSSSVSNLESSDISLSQRIDSISTDSYNDASINSRVSTDEVNLISTEVRLDLSITNEVSSRISGDESVKNEMTLSVSSLNQRVDGIVIPTMVSDISELSDYTGLLIHPSFDDSSLSSRISTVEQTVSGLPSSESYDDTSIETRLSGQESTTASSVNSLNSRVDNIGGSTYNDTSINSRVSTLESDFDSISIPTEYNDGSINSRVSNEEDNRLTGDLSLTSRLSNLETTHDLDEQSINSSISTNDSSIISLGSKLSTVINNDISNLNSLVSSLQTLISAQASTIISLDDKVEYYHSTDVASGGGSTTPTTTSAPTESYLMYADSGAGAGQVLFNGNNNQFYPFLTQGAPTTFDVFVNDRLNNSNKITTFTHDVCSDKATVTYTLDYVGDSSSSNEVQAFYLHPASQGTVETIIDTATNLVYNVTPNGGQTVTINGSSYKVYRWLLGQPDGTQFTVKVSTCL